MEDFVMNDDERAIADECAFEHFGVPFSKLTDLKAKREYYEIAKETWAECGSEALGYE